MSGDWIKMRVNLVTHPKVLRLAEILLNDGRYLDWSALSYAMASYPPCPPAEAEGERHAALRITRYVCVTSLLRFWGYANEHAKGENIECIGAHDVDEIVGVPGFGDAIGSVGWASFATVGGVELPGFSEHNTSADVRRSGAAERQKAYRERLKLKAIRDVTRDVTSQPREEKRREEIEIPKPARKARKTSLPQDFGVSERVRTWAAAKGLNHLDQQLEAFLSYARRSGQQYADWDEALMTAIRDDWAKARGKPTNDPFKGAI